jgi:hypothetical protein
VHRSHLLSGFAQPYETMPKRARRILATPRVITDQGPIPASATRRHGDRIGQKLAPLRVLRPAQKQGTNQKPRKRPRTERGGGRAATGDIAMDASESLRGRWQNTRVCATAAAYPDAALS